MLTLTENPPILSPRAASLKDLSGQWWVAHTRARFEKAFAWDMLAKDVGYFLPMAEQVRRSGGRLRRTRLPLFASYVFFCGTREDRRIALASNRVCQVIEVADQARLSRELAELERALSGNAQLDPYPFAVVGRRCRVAKGPFQGLEGTIVRRDDLFRLVLDVSILGQGAAMTIDAEQLEPI